ncbi:MAG: cytochrome-c peroxidase, partial [Bacteroidota bacterium]
MITHRISAAIPKEFSRSRDSGIAQTNRIANPPFLTYSPLNNSITNEGATLGRVLFYDNRLSLSRTISCASCHVQEFGFADPAPFSSGQHGEKGIRNSIGLSNAAIPATGKFFWD